MPVKCLIGSFGWFSWNITAILWLIRVISHFSGYWTKVIACNMLNNHNYYLIVTHLLNLQASIRMALVVCLLIIDKSLLTDLTWRLVCPPHRSRRWGRGSWGGSSVLRPSAPATGLRQIQPITHFRGGQHSVRRGGERWGARGQRGSRLQETHHLGQQGVLQGWVRNQGNRKIISLGFFFFSFGRWVFFSVDEGRWGVSVFPGCVELPHFQY